MELTIKLLEQIAFNTKPKIEEHMLIVMDKSIHEDNLFQRLQIINKQLKKEVTFLTGYNGFSNVINSNNRFYFKKTITDEDYFIKITIPPGTYEIERLNNEIRRIVIYEGHYSEANYPFTIKPNFSTLGYIIDISPQGPIISFIFDNSIRDFSGFNARTLYEECTPSNNPVDKFSFDNIFPDCNIAEGMIFRGKGSAIYHNFTMNVDPGYKYIE